MNSMTIAQLKEIADQKGLSYTAKVKKGDLIELLKGKVEVLEQPKQSFPGEY